jgi:hypothetical protein
VKSLLLAVALLAIAAAPSLGVLLAASLPSACWPPSRRTSSRPPPRWRRPHTAAASSAPS